MKTLVVLALGALLLGCGTVAPAATSTAEPTPQPTTSVPTSTPMPASTAVTPSLPAGVSPGGNTWGASTGGYLTQVGERALFVCPPDGSEYSIWGTDVYTSDSSVCTAGVHSGMVTFEGGGQLIAELREGQQSYVGSERNGVTSRDYTSFGSSFILVGGPVPQASATPSTSDLSPEAAALLAHMPEQFRGDCMEVTSFDAGVLVSVQCINIPDVDGYLVYRLFDNSSNLQDSFFGNFDFFGEGVDDELDNCASGPSLIAYERDGLVEGRRFCNTYTSLDPEGLITFWFDEGLLIEANIVLYGGTFADMDALALSAGPSP